MPSSTSAVEAELAVDSSTSTRSHIFRTEPVAWLT